MIVALGLIFLGGALGGIVNSFLSDNGYLPPKRLDSPIGPIRQPGMLGNMLVGGIAAVLSFALYGDLSSRPILSWDNKKLVWFPRPTDSQLVVLVTLAAFAGAIVIGIGGARWLTNEIHKRIQKAALAELATRFAPADAARLVAASPAGALEIAMRIK